MVAKKSHKRILIIEDERPMAKTLKARQEVLNQQRDIEYVRKDGTRFPVAISVSPMAVGGELIGAVEVFRDITKEQQVDKAKTEFVSLASHQLRTPLTAISWYTEMLLTDDKKGLSDTQEDYLNEVRLATERMIDLVNALLNVSRIELGTYAVEPVELDVKKVLQDVIRDVGVLAKDRKVSLVTDDARAPDRYLTDPNLLGMVFQNLISNALKYTPEGTVTVRVYADDTWLNIEVEDTGYGIPDDQRDQIFTKLFRADNVKAQDTTGTGLGLYIIKAVIEEVGGSIRFESEEGKGTTFFVRLPIEGMQPKQGSKPLES